MEIFGIHICPHCIMQFSPALAGVLFAYQNLKHRLRAPWYHGRKERRDSI